MSVTSIDLPWSWLITGLVTGGGLIALIVWLRGKNISVRWYEWLMGVLGVFLILFALQNIFAAIDEYESQATLWYILILGLPGLIFLVLPAQLVNMRNRKAG